MANQQPTPKPNWTTEQLIEALNDMRDAWTSAALELRDIQFHLNTEQRQQATERFQELLRKVK